LLSLVGLVLAIRERRPAHRLILSWMGVWFLILSVFGTKWGRFFISVLPAFLILAAYAAALIVERARRASAKFALPATAAIAVLLVGVEAEAAVTHAPHERLYISPLGGGDAKVTWYFP